MFPTRQLRLHDPTIRSVAVVGLAKNVGKTTALGRLEREARGADRVVGLVSTGMDGERRDAVFGFAKPPVRLSAGVWVATAAQGLASATAPWFDEGDAHVATPFGEVRLARAAGPGEVTLIGPRTVAQLDRVVRALGERGVDLVLVDGSVDRRAVASAASTDGVILVVGAAVARDLSAVIDEAARVVRLLGLPPDDDPAPWPEGIELITEDGQRRCLELDSALGREDALAETVLGADAARLRCPGAVRGELLLALARGARRGHKVPHLTALTGTHVFADARALNIFERTQARLQVARPTRLLGVAMNPVSPAGWRLPADELRARLQELVPGLPVFDAQAD